MTAYPSLKRCLAAGLTLFVIGAPLAYWLYTGGNGPLGPNPAGAQGAKETGDWIMYGGTPARNMVNTTAKKLPAEWDVDAKKNIKWVANLGSKAYGGPIVAGGKVIIGTNNKNPRDKKNWGFDDPKTGKLVDLGVVMCFDEANGNFLWQAVHEKLPGGQVVDWPLEGVCSSAVVEGDVIYYVSNSCEVVCADIKTGKPIPTFGKPAASEERPVTDHSFSYSLHLRFKNMADHDHYQKAFERLLKDLKPKSNRPGGRHTRRP